MKAENINIRRVLEAKTTQELLHGYKEWAADYDKDLADLEYVAPAATAKALMDEVRNSASTILDAGCGTGLVGKILSQAGYTAIDALDYSQDMLDQARKKKIYDQLYCEDMNTTLSLGNNTYDAVICVGAFTFGHVRPQALDELIRITKPSGSICFTVRDEAYEEFDYRSHMLKLETEGAWELRELRRENYIVGENTYCKLCTYRVL